MPQLDFSWWLVNFMLIWTAVVITFVVVSNNISSQENSTPSNGEKNVQKTSTEWQWS
uniref:ATP synthase complex subunit 8 n=1 Tax=Echinothrix calamaris TaxID=742514 RepID=Q8W7G2_ECHCL|nr:ATP synthase F0 subunit 8 [Echinothrix calamaris]AAG47339.1 ATP8 [Echinothrix calamaris]AAG47341.1 ATP8 [Echinothrix calamaris]QLM01975.1 ATP synthase F0 subunit 8 [Echinothrix calamaris]QYJ10629.1 ATP synthase subunit 8 [Echinothrix calamaris]QYJ10630.1 ATP synthase subunit 8 [Echinothrix calamaris]